MYPSFVLLITSFRTGKGLTSMRTGNRKATPTQPLQFHVKFMCMPCSSASVECIFQHMFRYGPTSETDWMQRRLKKWLKYTNFTELKKITSKICRNCTI